MKPVTHRNRAQRVLYNMGRNGIGDDAANTLKPHEVRRQGVRSLGRKAVAAVAITVGAAAGGALLGNAIDRSPTQKHYVETVNEQEEREVDQIGSTQPVPAATGELPGVQGQEGQLEIAPVQPMEAPAHAEGMPPLSNSNES